MASAQSLCKSTWRAGLDCVPALQEKSVGRKRVATGSVFNVLYEQDEADLSASQLAWLGAGDHAYFLQGQLEHPRPIEAELEVSSPELPPAPEPEQRPAPWLDPAPALVPPPMLELEPVSPPSVPPGPEPPPTSAPAPVPAPELEPAGPLAPGRILTPPGEITAEPDPVPEPTCCWDVTSKNLLREEKPDILEFLPRLVAEQLTLIDVVNSEALTAGGVGLPCAMSFPTPAIS
ncbi:ral guanine nucleotide dissociation stimulator-like [Diceros bicornis minor]|uniref:ral guanine nucleotide dissociation stimulator-like n=1 Tax=Diceros bicornis minor TaxID=77932 RepID=UPI0026EAFDF4|nr:ral guanine nucleotide dissociation stimulator-like [Diceros bicornis minor]